MDACSLLLGRPWQWDNDAIHLCKQNIYTVAFAGKRIGFEHLPPNLEVAHPTDQVAHQEIKKANQGVKKDKPKSKEEPKLLHLASKTALGLNRKERKAVKRERLLTLRQEPKIKVGDSIWLSWHLQKTYDEDMIGRDNEAPFTLQKKELLGTDQIRR